MMPSQLPILQSSASVIDAIRSLDQSHAQIVLVEHNQRLAGTVTDGDIRRSILAGRPLDSAIAEVMNAAPVTAGPGTTDAEAMQIMRRHGIHQLPIVDDAGRVLGLKLFDELAQGSVKDNWVVLMAGGLGSRLRPLTENVPKPLIPVGGKPILQTIINNFVTAGFGRFFISVNYKAELVEDFLGDGQQWGVQIEYLRENGPLGTAGALGLLPERPTKPFFVMNGDLLTTANFQQMLAYHEEQKASATMCVLEHTVQIPYGVVELDGDRIQSIVEKPSLKRFISAGIYVLNPSILDQIPEQTKFDMPSLIEKIVDSGGNAAAFPLREYWVDIGRMEDLSRASSEYADVFSE